MGCGSAKDVKVTSDMQIRIVTLQTGIIEFDQIFLLLAEVLGEAEDIRQTVVPARYNMIHIVKAHHLANPTISEVFRLYTLGLSCCNQGKSKSNGVKFNMTENKFEFDVGISGEYRFDWFGDYLNDYISGVARAVVYFPQVKAKCEALFDRIKGMKDNILSYASIFPEFTDKIKAGGLVTANVAVMALGLKICLEFSKSLDDYHAEIKELISTYQQIESQADVQGLEIYNAYGATELPKLEDHQTSIIGQATQAFAQVFEKTRYRMKVKMNDVVCNYSNLERRTVEEQDADTELKLHRSKGKPRKNKNYKPDDLPCDEKHFPWRLRWVGINILDLPLQQMSVALEDHQIQKDKLHLCRRLISHKLELFVLEEENMLHAFQIFVWALTNEHGSLKEKLSVKDLTPYCVGLDKIKGKNKDLEEVRQYFLEYFYLCSPDRRGPLDESWATFNEKFGLLMQWSLGEFTKYPTFKLATLTDQYNMMTNVAKNIYAMRAYKPVAVRVYGKGFLRVKKASEDFWSQAESLILSADEDPNQKKCKGVHLKDIALKVFPGAKRSADKITQRRQKLEQFYNEYKKK